MIFEAQLKNNGFTQQVISTESPLEALKILDGKHDVSIENDAVIVLDIGLPDMDGLELAQQIRMRPERIDTPIIILTGSADLQHVQAAKSARVAGYILKDKMREVLESERNPISRVLA